MTGTPLPKLAGNLRQIPQLLMARSYKRDSLGRFSGGGISSGLAARKKAVSTQVSNDSLAGKKVSSARKGYVRAQAADAQKAAARSSGKGSKAARRAAAAKAPKGSFMDRINAARAAGRAAGKAAAAKTSSRNTALNRKAKAYGG